MEVCPLAKLNKQSTFGYKSFGSSYQLADDSSPNAVTCDLTQNRDPIYLKQLACGGPNLSDQSPSNLTETDEDCTSRDTPAPVYALAFIFSIGVTIALVLQIYLGESLAFQNGELFSDHEGCTALGHRVLHDGGSSVDAAIAGALCLGVVHPHVSGVGGGGVMLVHDMHRNETRVINFLGTAPKAFSNEMLHNLSEVKAALQVGVPGMLRGLHHAHTLYGSLPWEDVVSRAADIAREGFNVSHSLADAISKIKGEQLSQHFGNTFMPDGRPLSPGSYVRLPGLAGVLEAGLLNFYHGNLSQEMVDEVRANGGVLSREDIGNYSVEEQLPLEGQYNEFVIQVPPPPSAGAVLLSALNFLEGFHISKNSVTGIQTHHWIAEALKAALAMASGLGDPNYNSSVTEALSNMLSKSQAEVLRQQLRYSQTSPSESLPPIHSIQTEPVAGQVIVLGPDNLIVSVVSSLSRPFGSGLITRSGIILNSLILDFSWPNKSRDQVQTNQLQKNCVEPGKRPLSFLMPVIMVPAVHKCGIHTALSTSGGENALSAIIQMLVNMLFLHTERNVSFPLRRLHHQFEPNRLLVHSQFQEESV